jgi:tetratricopeptide (TPR) repeat protein
MRGCCRINQNRFSNLKIRKPSFFPAIVVLLPRPADFPTRPEFGQDLGMSYINLGALLRDSGQVKDAEAVWTDAVALFKRLAANFPTRPELRRELARSQNNLGILFEATGRVKEAVSAYADALAVRTQLAADFPNRPEFRQELARSHNNLGILFKNTGRLLDSQAAYQQALILVKQLAADFPNQPDLCRDLAGTLVNLAILCNQRREFAAAKSHLAEARPHHEAALKANSRHPTYLEFYLNNLWALAQTNAGLLDPVGAARAAKQIRDLGWNPPGDAYAAAHALALCIPIVQKDDHLDLAKRQAAAQLYADEAMKMLNDAVAKGWRDATRIKKDTDFEPLRDREDFKKLIAKFEKKISVEMK